MTSFNVKPDHESLVALTNDTGHTQFAIGVTSGSLWVRFPGESSWRCLIVGPKAKQIRDGEMTTIITFSELIKPGSILTIHIT